MTADQLPGAHAHEGAAVGHYLEACAPALHADQPAPAPVTLVAAAQQHLPEAG